jgi:hypothetical protein
VLHAIVLDLRHRAAPVWLPEDLPGRALLVTWGGDEKSVLGHHTGERLPCDATTHVEDVAQLARSYLGLAKHR